MGQQGFSYLLLKDPDIICNMDHMQLFTEAANAFDDLGNKAKEVASEAIDAEAIFADIPDEFLDPIQLFYLGFRIVLLYLFTLVTVCLSVLVGGSLVMIWNMESQNQTMRYKMKSGSGSGKIRTHA
ncbi:zinc finger, RING/FYVE/PHD-type, Ubiquitin conjugation factor E4 [Artemisia annua]|uniref:Zinc finger, RING/FYVE/PHD-type, Ubiquitin conjugation factor E4 n=1 Tax=Artemisia annua TaxID=35608 RepID=A0A2U1NXJ8_ARTAN|nr:zinc finger, RING/FYVE/PHD-type, Ubiquitin conjugation factor E4 [Artemisia annua]